MTTVLVLVVVLVPGQISLSPPTRTHRRMFGPGIMGAAIVIVRVDILVT